ncbi:MAG: hypothetical protein AAB426_08450, partial [Myxococcota bacterium]
MRLPPRVVFPGAAAVLLGVGVLVGARVHRDDGRSHEPAARRAQAPEEGTPIDAVPLRSARSWVAIGGGAEPASNQVSLEQDLALAASVLGEGGYILFGGGAKSQGVQVQHRTDVSSRAPLREHVAALFAPRVSAGVSYEPVTIGVDGPTTEAATHAALEGALSLRRGPLLLYFAAHGEPGETPRDNVLRLWGGWPLIVADLATMLDGAANGPPVRVVVAACHGGGFAELAFRDADATQGPAAGDRCGLFATTWDRVASGCDPNPLRAVQEGYSLHFWHALRGEDREGTPLPHDLLDYDGDGVIGLLDAHTRARIASRSFDVPTTTSERWLREVAPRRGPATSVELPEERGVLRELGGQLGLDTAGAARRREALEREQQALDDALDDADAEVGRLTGELIGKVLSRWPLLDDPWHPAFEATLERYGTAIGA